MSRRREGVAELAEMKEVRYDYVVGHRLRVRVHLVLSGKDVSQAAIALEYEWHQGDWRRVVCIDNYGGRWHRDRLRPDRSHYERHEAVFHTADVHQGVAWPTAELCERGEAYVATFRRLADDV